MPTNEERREVAARLRDMAVCEHISDAEDFGMVIKRAFREMVPIPRSDYSFLCTIADLIEPEPICIANITFTAEQQEELFQRVMEEFRVNGCPNCGARVEEDK